MNTRKTLYPSARAVRASCGLAAVLFGIPLAAAPLDRARPATAQRYVSLHAGLNNPSSWTARVDAGAAGLDLEPGGHAGLAFGRQAGPARYEVEFQHGRLNIERAGIGTVSEAASESGGYSVLTVNAMRELFAARRVTVYGGAGAGVARVELPYIALANGSLCLDEAHSTGLAWQARIGAEGRIGKPGWVFAQLSYLRLPGPKAQGYSSIGYRSRGMPVLSFGYRQRF